MLKKLLWNVEERAVEINGTDMDYVSFGRGDKILVMIPGLSDGIKTVMGTGLMLRYIYRFLARDYRVYVFSRKNKLEKGYTTRGMARDLAQALDKLHIAPANVLGVSQGGMIAQWLAIDYPEKVLKLVIAISVSGQNEILQEVIKSWIKMASDERYDDLAIDMLEKTHSDSYLKKVRPFYWLVKRISKPQSKERFLIQAESCRTHDAYRELKKINCPAFVIGGGSDRVVGGLEVQQEMADAITGSRLFIYPHLGHGAYAEANDFGERICSFFKEG